MGTVFSNDRILSNSSSRGESLITRNPVTETTMTLGNNVASNAGWIMTSLMWAFLVALIVVTSITLHKVNDLDSDCVELDCPPEFTHNPPNLGSLSLWTTEQWNPTLEFLINDPTDYQYIYNSELALPGGSDKIFGTDYAAHIDSTTYIPGTSPGVPGPFNYSLPYSGWGGDNVTVGSQYYSNILAHFGHWHILGIQARSIRLFENGCAVTEAEDKGLEHLLFGSTQIFNWYGQVVDLQGNLIDYSADSTNLLGQISGLINLLINKPGDGEVSIDSLLGAMDLVIGNAVYTPGGAPQITTLTDERNRLESFLTDVLFLCCDDKSSIFIHNRERNSIFISAINSRDEHFI